MTAEDFITQRKPAETTGIIEQVLQRNGEEAMQKAIAPVAESIPRQAMGGVRDAIQEGMEGIDALAGWLESRFPDATAKGNKLLFGDERGWVDPQGNPIQLNLPEVEPATTLTGGITRGVTQFLTGFIPSAKATGLFKATGASAVRRGVAAGAITDFAFFDPQQERLSNLVQEYPQLSNPITEYLAASPYDGEMEGRMKNVLEGFGIDAGLGAVFMAGLKGYRAARVTKATPADEVDAAAVEVAAPAKEGATEAPKRIAFAPPEPPKPILGNPKGKLVSEKIATEEEAQNFLSITTPVEGKAVNINLARISASDDIKKAITETAKYFKTDMDDANRSVQTNKVTQELAQQLGMSVDDLLARQKGQAFNAEQAVAARSLLVASADKLTMMAKSIKEGNNSADDLYAFRKMVETHKAIQLQVTGLTAEAGRALQSFNIQAKSRRQQLRAIDDVLNQTGGQDVINGIAETLVKLSEDGADNATISQAAAKMARVTSLDTLLTLRQGALLSGYRTHMVNIASNTATMFSAIPERFLAGAITAARGGDGVAMREATEMFRGMIGGSWEALSIASRAFKDNVEFDIFQNTPEFRNRTITAGTLSQNNLGKAIGAVSKSLGGKALGEGGYADNLVNGLGWAVDLPFRALGAEDAFFKHLNARMELQALAWRQAEKEGLSGVNASSRVAELVANPPDELIDAAVKYARVQTFTNTNRTAGAIQAALNQVKVARFIVPFVQTPTNIVKYGLERTPVAPLFADVRADLTAGGARKALAEARIAMGTSVMIAAGSLAASGKITGAAPRDPKLRAIWLQENQPYSIKTKEGWKSYNRLDPWGMVLGMGADMWQVGGAADDDTLAQMASMSVISLANNVLNKAWLTGISDFMEAVNDPERKGGQYIDYMMASFMPVLMKQMNYDFNDPVIRDFDTAWQGIVSRTPGFSDAYPAKRDIWGGMRLYMGTATPKGEPLNELLIRRQIPVGMPSRYLSYGAGRVKLNAEEYSRYVELAREPAKQALDGMLSQLEAIEGMGVESPLDKTVKNVLSSYANQAREQMFREYPEIIYRYEEETINQQ